MPTVDLPRRRFLEKTSLHRLDDGSRNNMVLCATIIVRKDVYFLCNTTYNAHRYVIIYATTSFALLARKPIPRSDRRNLFRNLSSMTPFCRTIRALRLCVIIYRTRTRIE
jgi:hypothetical protein